MIKVIIERQIAEGLSDNYDRVAQTMLGATLKAPGYVSGESWQDLDDPNHRFIITTWRSREAWNRWFNSPERREALSVIQPIMDGEERVRILG